MTEFTSERLAELKAVAEAATNSAWEQDEDIPEAVCASWNGQHWYMDAVHEEDAAHIATFDPPTTLALIAALEAKTAEVEDARKYRTLPPGYVWQDYYSPDEVIKLLREAGLTLEKAERRAEAAEDALERVRALHQPEDTEVITGDDAAEECDHEEDCPTVTIQVCDGCRALGEKVYPYFEEERISVVEYPCATIRALETGENDE